MNASPPARSIAGLRLLLVEDEALLQLYLEDMVEGWGAVVVGRAATLDVAERLAETVEADAALLDLNLNGDLTYDVAVMLLGRGIAVIFVTGYERGSIALPRGAAVVRKPIDPAELRAALLETVAPDGAGSR